MTIKEGKGMCNEIRGGLERLAADDSRSREMNDRSVNEAVKREESEGREVEKRKQSKAAFYLFSTAVTWRGSGDLSSVFTLAQGPAYYHPDEYLFICISGFVLLGGVLFGLARAATGPSVCPQVGSEEPDRVQNLGAL